LYFPNQRRHPSNFDGCRVVAGHQLLFREQQEAVERLAATAEVLYMVGRSPGNRCLVEAQILGVSGVDGRVVGG
jgi:hypothetical protein